jgi:hypothetical protein
LSPRPADGTRRAEELLAAGFLRAVDLLRALDLRVLDLDLELPELVAIATS